MSYRQSSTIKSCTSNLVQTKLVQKKLVQTKAVKTKIVNVKVVHAKVVQTFIKNPQFWSKPNLSKIHNFGPITESLRQKLWIFHH